MDYLSNSVEETEALGAELAGRLEPGDVVAFTGDLGAAVSYTHLTLPTNREV